MDAFTLEDVISRVRKVARQDAEDLLARGRTRGIWTKIEDGVKRQGDPWTFESDREEYLAHQERAAVYRLFEHLCTISRALP